jgi:galactitol-specific phosphotransferase system IIC component
MKIITNVYYISLLIIVIIFATTMAWAAEEKSTISNYSQLPSSSSPTSSSISLNNTNVDFATNIEFIKGHLSAAILNKQAGNDELAQTHTFHQYMKYIH